jgi:hypothetical protein
MPACLWAVGRVGNQSIDVRKPRRFVETTPMPTFTAQGSMFEGLYVKVLKPTGAFRDDLAKAGFDVQALRPEYPMDVWVACLDVTAKHLHPTLERFAAWRLIGRDFITGFLDTIVAAWWPWRCRSSRRRRSSTAHLASCGWASRSSTRWWSGRGPGRRW